LLPFALRVFRTARQAPVTATHAEVLVLFGKRLTHGAMDDEFRQRADRLANLLRQTPRRMCVLLGGTLPGQTVSEARVAAEYLRTAKVEGRSQLILEQGSRHTLENLRNARLLLAESGDLRCTLISSRYHLARCQAIATSLGFQATLARPLERAYLRDNAARLLGR